MDLLNANQLINDYEFRSADICPSLSADQLWFNRLIKFHDLFNATVQAIQKLNHSSVRLSFRFVVAYTECDPAAGVGVGVGFMKNGDVDMVLGPPCPYG